MSASAAAPGTLPRIRSLREGTRSLADRLGDRLFMGLTVLASLAVVTVIALIIDRVIAGSIPAISRFGISFIWRTTWNPSESVGVADANVFGAGVLVYGTAVTSALALLIAVPLGVAIAVYLSLLARGRVAAVVGPLVELLASVPSVILGFLGIILLAPFLRSTINPALHSVLGWIPLFGEPGPTGLGMFNAGIILAIMVLPIVAAISRDLFLSVPRELKDGALALGATPSEMIRGVVLDSTKSGIMAASILGLSRALGEAVAVTQVIGAGTSISTNLFASGDTLASRIAEQFVGATSKIQTASLFYCALILLVMELFANLIAQAITIHYGQAQGARS